MKPFTNDVYHTHYERLKTLYWSAEKDRVFPNGYGRGIKKTFFRLVTIFEFLLVLWRHAL